MGGRCGEVLDHVVEGGLPVGEPRQVHLLLLLQSHVADLVLEVPDLGLQIFVFVF